MRAKVRELRADERGLLRGFLHLAIHVPPGGDPVHPGLVDTEPGLRHYVEGFGQEPGDLAVAAEVDGAVVGVAWSRLLGGDDPGYGHVDDDTPELTVSVLPDHREQGIGTALVGALMTALAQAGFVQVSLSVDKTNPAQDLYRRLGFHTVLDSDDRDDLVMVHSLTGQL